MQCRITTYKGYFCTLILPKNEERHLCSGFLAVLCVTDNVLWLHLWLLFSTVRYFPYLCFSSRMAEEAPYYKEFCSSAQELPYGTQEHEWLASNAREMLSRLPHIRNWMTPDTHHYSGNAGVNKWKRQHQTGNLQTCHRKHQQDP